MKDKDRIIEIMDFVLGRGEVLRLSLVTFHGKHGLDLRVWFTADDGNLRPTKRGTRLPIRNLKALKRATRKAYNLARKNGMVEGISSENAS